MRYLFLKRTPLTLPSKRYLFRFPSPLADTRIWQLDRRVLYCSLPPSSLPLFCPLPSLLPLTLYAATLLVILCPVAHGLPALLFFHLQLAFLEPTILSSELFWSFYIQPSPQPPRFLFAYGSVSEYRRVAQQCWFSGLTVRHFVTGAYWWTKQYEWILWYCLCKALSQHLESYYSTVIQKLYDSFDCWKGYCFLYHIRFWENMKVNAPGAVEAE